MLERIVLVLTVAACGGQGTPPPTNHTQPTPAGGIPAALYSQLFVDGARFTYEVETASSHWDDQDPKADKNGSVSEKGKFTMTCTVGSVARQADSISAELSCDHDIDVPVADASPAGTYVATAEGLWRTAPGDPRTPENMLLAANPVARHVAKEGLELDVKRGAGDTWCSSRAFTMGDDGGTEMCFGGGKLMSGSAAWGGGSTKDANYHLVK